MGINEKIKQYIQGNCINQKEICLKMGISEKKFNKILKKTKMNCYTLYAICKALNVSLNTFFE